jgi:hypothetical protein
MAPPSNMPSQIATPTWSHSFAALGLLNEITFAGRDAVGEAAAARRVMGAITRDRPQGVGSDFLDKFAVRN